MTDKRSKKGSSVKVVSLRETPVKAKGIPLDTTALARDFEIFAKKFLEVFEPAKKFVGPWSQLCGSCDRVDIPCPQWENYRNVDEDQCSCKVSLLQEFLEYLAYTEKVMSGAMLVDCESIINGALFNALTKKAAKECVVDSKTNEVGKMLAYDAFVKRYHFQPGNLYPMHVGFSVRAKKLKLEEEAAEKKELWTKIKDELEKDKLFMIEQQREVIEELRAIEKKE